MRDAESIRKMLVDRPHLLPPHPVDYGDESVILSLMQGLTFIDERENDWKEYKQALRGGRTLIYNSSFW